MVEDLGHCASLILAQSTICNTTRELGGAVWPQGGPARQSALANVRREGRRATSGLEVGPMFVRRARCARHRSMAAVLLSIGFLLVIGASWSCYEPPVTAFPGAEGFGAFSQGGRGGRVIEVTNLDDLDAAGQVVPGSLRAAIEATGRRIIVFRVGGTIRVCEQNRPLAITEPFVTIAGQTAPGGGIALRLDPSCAGSALSVWTHDVVIRHLRIRPGSNPAVDGGGSDAITISGPNAFDVIIDHCSFSWATDEVVDVAAGARAVTVQRSIISEALLGAQRAVGGDSGGYGMLIAEGDWNGNHTRNVSILRNVFAHNWYRNPQVGVDGIVDVRNNVIYDWGLHGIRVLDSAGPTRINIVGNLAIPGPSTTDPAETRELWALHAFGYAPFSYFVAGNIGPRRPNETLPDLASVWCREHDPNVPNSGIDCPPEKFATSTPWATGGVTTSDPHDAYVEGILGAGATLPRRDAVDTRVMIQIANGTGGMVTDPASVGGWPVLANGTPPPDTDRDGMPDSWETLYGLDPLNAADGNLDADSDGYRNVEEFLNGTNPLVPDAGL
jgi:hypothetical protein